MMWYHSALLFLGIVFHTSQVASGLGSSCSAPLGSSTASPTDPYWLETIQHQGTSAFNSNSPYKVFRNVKDFGGWRVIGNAKNPPTLLASPSFNGFAVIYADPYIPNGYGTQWFINQDNFLRSVRNFIVDLRQVPSANSVIGFHWQVSQATSLVNVVVEMSTAAGTNHQGLLMESGRCAFNTYIVFNGGKIGIQVGSQKFTVRNLTVDNADTAVLGVWNRGFTIQGVTINGCQTIGSEAIIDALVTNMPISIRSSTASNGTLAGSLVLDNVELIHVPTAVGVVGGITTQILNSASSVTVYSLSTVGASYQLSVRPVGVVNEGDNPDGFQETITAWNM
ncbi:glycoside hydrolase family 55 protein [Paxillus rubicundulus Ve08.2h10]|uniref:Glycoside hydrolase family 55 protein n=1 Tax=Paxillus rubicundulus Ve08.2h10 TaxID=930991 RepID=A0A0D0D769_9AGAM|nr:glycoside hydrolase family 55 protein [Paxillus rubicundulus Ve08.2h10]